MLRGDPTRGAFPSLWASRFLSRSSSLQASNNPDNDYDNHDRAKQSVSKHCCLQSFISSYCDLIHKTPRICDKTFGARLYHDYLRDRSSHCCFHCGRRKQSCLFTSEPSRILMRGFFAAGASAPCGAFDTKSARKAIKLSSKLRRTTFPLTTGHVHNEPHLSLSDRWATRQAKKRGRSASSVRCLMAFRDRQPVGNGLSNLSWV